MVTLAHHQAARQDAHGPIEDADIYVHFKAVYTLSLKERLGECDDGRVRGTQEFFHTGDITAPARNCRALGRK